MKAKGKVYLIGAGPGDPELLTLRAVAILGRADVVVYDGLVNPEVLRHAPPSAEIIYGGKHDRTRAVSQDVLNQLLIQKAKEGKCVARLKGGDPYVFARGGEEACLLAEAGIAFEVVPGISSAEAVPNYAGIPLTHRDFCSSYTVVTGHRDPADAKSHVDWARMAQIPGTLVILMGLKNIRNIASALMAHGRAGDTPAAMIQSGATGRQSTVTGTLSNIADLGASLKPPVVTVIGEVVKLRDRLNWFEKRSLLGQRIVITRSRDQSEQLARPLRELGADVLEMPVIKMVSPTERTPMIEALAGLHSYDWIVFTSPNGVGAFFDSFFKAFKDLRDIGGVRIAAVGPGTAAKLAELHLQVDVTPEESLGSKIAEALVKYESIENLRILLPRAEAANPELPKLLEANGAIVDDVPWYKTVPETLDAQGAGAQLTETGADWIVFTSGSTVNHFHERFPLSALVEQYPSIRFASIGPETSKALAIHGHKAHVEAKAHTIEGLIQAIQKAVLQPAK
jgi:uroporphyrinogen III methyltransferase/synthase